MVLCDLALGGRLRRRRLAAPDPAPPAGAAGRARVERQRRHRARVHGVPRDLRVGVAQGLPQPRAGQPLQRRLLAARHRADRAADPPHPQRHGGRRDGRRELQGRVQLRPARDQLPLRRRAAHRRRPRDLQERRQGDRRPGGDGDQLHGQVRRARGQLVPHPLLARRRRRAQRVCLATGGVRVLPGRPARLPARADAAAGARTSTPTSASWRGRSPRPRSPGASDNRTCALRVVGHGQGLRFELRAGGSDLNPYMALSAIIAAGLHGVDTKLELEPDVRGQRL